MPRAHWLQRIRPPAMAIRSPDQTGLVRDNVMAVFDHVLEIDLGGGRTAVRQGRGLSGMTLQCKSTLPGQRNSQRFHPRIALTNPGIAHPWCMRCACVVHGLYVELFAVNLFPAPAFSRPFPTPHLSPDP